MTRIGHQNLTAGNLTAQINSPERPVEFLVIYNNNPVPVYIRLGSPEIPNQRNFDVAVPPSYIMAISVNSEQFGFRLGDDNLAVALLTGTTVIEGMIDEAPPSLGGVPIAGASLSTSQLTNGPVLALIPSTSATFDLLFWGGAIIYVLPTNVSGQGVMTVQQSQDQVTWFDVAQYAFWRSVPFEVNAPRVMRFMRLVFQATSIPLEPQIQYFYSVRATLEELPSVGYTGSTAVLANNYNVPNLGTVDYIFCTVGLRAVSARIVNTSGNEMNVIFSTSNVANVAASWGQAFFREQLVSTFNTVYRSVGALDNFLRIRIQEIGNNGPIVGSLTMSIQTEPDTTAVLNSIFAALGDIQQPVNVNQSIFHLLENIQFWNSIMVTILGEIDTNTDSIEPLINSSNILLAQIATSTANADVDLTTIIASLATVNGNLGTVISNLSAISTNTANTVSQLTTANTNLVTIGNNTGNTVAALANVNTNLGTIITTLQTIEAATRAQTTATQNITAVTGAAGVWVNSTAVLPANSYIQEMSFMGVIQGQLVVGGTFQVALGSAGGPAQIIQVWDGFGHYVQGPVEKYDGPRTGGIFVSSSQTNVWILHSTSVAVRFVGSMKYRT